MSIKYDDWTGWPSNLEGSFHRRVSAYVRNCDENNYKIGITNNPERRFREHKRSGYNKMIVMYRTSSWKSAGDMEDRLIEYCEKYSANLVRGGGGSYGDPPYFLYLIIKDEYDE